MWWWGPNGFCQAVQSSRNGVMVWTKILYLCLVKKNFRKFPKNKENVSCLIQMCCSRRGTLYCNIRLKIARRSLKKIVQISLFSCKDILHDYPIASNFLFKFEKLKFIEMHQEREDSWMFPKLTSPDVCFVWVYQWIICHKKSVFIFTVVSNRTVFLRSIFYLVDWLAQEEVF